MSVKISAKMFDEIDSQGQIEIFLNATFLEKVSLKVKDVGFFTSKILQKFRGKVNY